MPTTVFGKTLFPYSEQIGSVFCGQACTQMMLSYLQVQLPNNPQTTLTTYKDTNVSSIKSQVSKDISDLWGKWASSPDQVINMLHGPDQSSNHWINYFDKTKHSNSFASTRDAFLLALVSRAKNDAGIPPPIIPIHSGSHWVILFQYSETVNKDGTLSRSFIGNDPIYYPTETGIGPSGSASFSWEGKISVAHKNINFKDLENLLIIEETYQGNQFSRLGRQPSIPEPPVLVAQPRTPIAPNLLREIVLRKLDSFGISSPCLAGRHLQGTTPSPPLLVRRMGRNPMDYSDDYYLIGMQTSDLKNKLLVRIDATTGLYLDSLGIPPTAYLFGSATPVSMLNQVLSQPEMPNELKMALEQLFTALPSPGFKLVWKPCTQSQSAFYPFYEITISQPRPVKYYIRIDGRFFTESQLTIAPNT
ncbi:MAG TPA: hypothetical protein PLD20_08510 [Blastocatellia bacterium]|nr:hypothetical protein [Blastocatellia bacterium]HMX24922.1 hypothetical protein [Blastocatellia bacterium]HMZ17957.1 hypothetical protein [Blastocatellia bacterium]